MNADLKVVRAINGVAGKHRTMDLALDAFTRTGHLTFVLYGLWMWFGPGMAWDKSRRRRSAMMVLFSCGTGFLCIHADWKNLEQKAALCKRLENLEFYRT